MPSHAPLEPTDLVKLNEERWRKHIQAQELQVLMPHGQGAAKTDASALFRRPNPLNVDGMPLVPFNRTEDLHRDPKADNYLQKTANYNEGRDRRDRTIRGEEGYWVKSLYKGSGIEDKDGQAVTWKNTEPGFTGTAANSTYKYRIPNTSVVNKKGDCKILCCVGYRMTAAQWIWWLNLFCFIAHITMIIVVMHFAYFRNIGKEELNGCCADPFSTKGTQHMMVKIYRISAVPTMDMIERNVTVWSANRWNGTLVPPEFYLRPNHLDVNYASLVISFFAISAVFHFIALILGLFENFWFWYWRQMDDGFCWWRWLEYSGSASIMAVTIAIGLGMREQSLLACIFFLHWSCMAFGFLTEYISTPKYYVDDKQHGRPIGQFNYRLHDLRVMRSNNSPEYKQFFNDTAARLKKSMPSASDQEVRDLINDYIGAPTDSPEDWKYKTSYGKNPRALKIISQSQWQGDHPLFDIASDKAVTPGDYPLVGMQRRSNYVRRMVPHVLGWFPLIAAWVCMITHLYCEIYDLKEHTTETIPLWVEGLVVGTVVIFISFAFVQQIFQALPPGFYWGSEILYCILSLTAKIWLGIFVLVNVLMVDPLTSVEGALTNINTGGGS